MAINSVSTLSRSRFLSKSKLNVEILNNMIPTSFNTLTRKFLEFSIQKKYDKK